MKNAVVALVVALGSVGCATTVEPNGCEESFTERAARGFAEGLFDALFDRMFGDGGTTKVAQKRDRWLSSKTQTSVSSPR